MNWRVIVPLGLTGALPPVLAMWMGGSPIVAAVAWTLLAAFVWVPAILWAKEARPFLALVAVGVVAGVVAGLIDAVTLGDPMLLVMALVIGTIWGALFGGIATWIARRRAVAA